MPCQEFEERLLEYDRLAVGERNVIDLHVGGCVECRTFFCALEEVDNTLIAAFSDRRVSAAFNEAVFYQVRRQAPSPRPSLVPEMLDAIGWAGAIAIMLGLMLFFVPGLDFNIPLAAGVGTMLVIAGFWIAYRCYDDLRRC